MQPAKPKRVQRSTVSKEQREKIHELFRMGMSNSAIVSDTKLPRSTVATIISKFQKTGTISPKPRGGDKRSMLNPKQKRTIASWIHENRMITLKQLQQKVLDEFGVTISTSTIYRVIVQFQYTLKSLVMVPERRICETVVSRRIEQANMYREWGLHVPTKLQMSPMKKEGIKVCCTSGTPSMTGGCEHYSPLGHVVELSADLVGYLTKPPDNNTSSAIILIYDIFGLDILQTKRFADRLATSTQQRVLIPDFFRGKPWLLENFPPKDSASFMQWVETAGSWDVVSEDLKVAHQFLLKDDLPTTASLGIVGFCWGGKQALRACAGSTHAVNLGFRFAAGVVLHGAFMGPDDAEQVTVPMLFMPAGDDPAIDPLKTVLDEKSFGSDCQYHRFDNETHGFAAARGDWNVPHTREAIEDALMRSTAFFLKYLPST